LLRGLHELGVPTREIRQLRDRRDLDARPVALGFKTIGKPSAQVAFQAVLEWLDVPAALVLRLFDQPDVPIRLDQRDAPFDSSR
jgi:hypothetical protein